MIAGSVQTLHPHSRPDNIRHDYPNCNDLLPDQNPPSSCHSSTIAPFSVSVFSSPLHPLDLNTYIV